VREGLHPLTSIFSLQIFLRNKLKYALTGREVTLIVAQRLVKVDGKVRTDNTYPAGFMDVISIDKSGEHFRLMYDVKGRFAVHRITEEESKYKLCKVRRVQLGAKGVPHLVTHDGRTIRYPDPAIKVNDTIKLLLPTTPIAPATAGAPNPTAVESSHKIDGFIKFEVGNLVMVTGGRNMGRAGTITHRERHVGGFDIVHVRDVQGRDFATRLSNIFVIGEGSKAWVSLPKGGGVKLSIAEERDVRRKQKEKERA